MFAYPSGHAHVGHVRNYIIGDVMARTKRMRGYNVLHPFGWDAFGLPAENAAIKTGTHPETSTLDNIAHMKGQLQRLGISYAWEREIATCLPDYYKFNQWIFLKMFERGLAYRKRSTVNWCPVDNTVLANEQVIDGACWRCGTTVVARDLEQWFFRITAVRRRAAERARHADRVAGKGRRDAAELDRPLRRRPHQVPASPGLRDQAIEIFTTRIDTIYGATFVAARARAPAGRSLRRREPGSGGVPRAQVAQFRALDREARRTGAIEKEGFDTGRHGDQSVHERGGADLDRQLRAGGIRHRRDHGGAGARRARLRVRAQIRPADPDRRPRRRTTPAAADAMTAPTTNYGRLVDSGEYTGRKRRRSSRDMIARRRARGIGTGEVQYRLKDWGISRQRYWGTPIPMIHCEKDGVVPVPYDQLPVELPKVTTFTGRGDSPLAQVPEFVNVTCPKCGGPARRETDTMDTFVDSSWYFLRFCDPTNTELPFDPVGRGATGCRSTSTAAASSTRSCTCCIRGSSRACCATSGW